MRKFLGIVAGLCLAGSAFAYVGSYFGATMESLSRAAISFHLGAFILHIGMFILLVPMFAAERAAVKDRIFFWKGFSQTRPTWAVPAIKLLALFFAIHFLVFAIQGHAASPQIRNGEYVLDNHGQILKSLTEHEYVKLKGAELRVFATGWIFFYFVLTTYWWYPRIVEGGPSENSAAQLL